jgi:hypothetical protein
MWSVNKVQECFRVKARVNSRMLIVKAEVTQECFRVKARDNSRVLIVKAGDN